MLTDTYFRLYVGSCSKHFIDYQIGRALPSLRSVSDFMVYHLQKYHRSTIIAQSHEILPLKNSRLP